MARSRFAATFLRLVLTAAALIATSPAYAQQGEDLREAAQNPIADLISLPFQNNTNFDIGRSENTQNVLNIQPVYPVHLNQSWNLITRPILPVISQPPFFWRFSALVLVTPSSALGISLRNFSFRQETPYSLVRTQAWYGVLGQLFSFQPRRTLNLDRESGLPAPALWCSCLTGRCT